MTPKISTSDNRVRNVKVTADGGSIKLTDIRTFVAASSGLDGDTAVRVSDVRATTFVQNDHLFGGISASQTDRYTGDDDK